MARRDGRILALQVLYGLDLCGDFNSVERALDQQVHESEAAPAPEAQQFAAELCRAVVAQLATIDHEIEQAAQHWRLDRMSPVDRNVLRLATAELLAHDAEAAVILNEAIEVARAFGSSDSARFVNGVLNEVARRLALSSGA